MGGPVASGSPCREAAHASHGSRVPHSCHRRHHRPHGHLRHRGSGLGGGSRAGGAGRTPTLAGAVRLQPADRPSQPVRRRPVLGMGAQDGSYPATGFHTRGEMGGFWTPPVKLLDGIWFRAGGSWLTASRYTSGWGYQRMDLGTHDGVRITRTDFAPDGMRAGLIGLRLDSEHGDDGAAGGGRALRADEGLSLGRDHTEPDDVQPPGHRCRQRQEPRLPRAGHSARHQRDPRLRGRRRLEPDAERQRASGRTTGARRATSSARRRARAARPRRTGATTRRTARASAVSCSTTCRCRRAAARSGSRSAVPTTDSPRRSPRRVTPSPTRESC